MEYYEHQCSYFIDYQDHEEFNYFFLHYFSYINVCVSAGTVVSMGEKAPLDLVPRPVGVEVLSRRSWFLDMVVRIAMECVDFEDYLSGLDRDGSLSLGVVERYVLSIQGLGNSLRGYYEKLLRKEARAISVDFHAKERSVT